MPYLIHINNDETWMSYVTPYSVENDSVFHRLSKHIVVAGMSHSFDYNRKTQTRTLHKLNQQRTVFVLANPGTGEEERWVKIATIDRDHFETTSTLAAKLRQIGAMESIQTLLTSYVKHGDDMFDQNVKVI